MNLNRNLPIKVVIYNESSNIWQFNSKEAAARFLNVNSRIITNHMDNWLKGGINGNYVFGRELNQIENEKLRYFFSLRKTRNCEVWVYESNNLESLYCTFKSIKKTADHFNVDYRSILNHLDTNKATIKNDKSLLFYSKNLTLEAIKEIKVEKIKNETMKLWIYKKVNNDLVLINENQPTFNSKNIAAKELKISPKTITKFLDTNNPYKDLYFYSTSFRPPYPYKIF